MRASQIFEFVSANEMPGLEDSRHHYTHFDAVSGQARTRLRKLRREYKKRANVYREEEQMVTLPDTGPWTGSSAGE